MGKKTTAERLQQIMEERNLRQTDILELCKPICEKEGVKLQKNDLSQYISGKFQPRQDKLTILSLALNVNEAWLMGYDVPCCDSATLNVINLYNKLDSMDKGRIIGTMEEMLRNDKYKDNGSG